MFGDQGESKGTFNSLPLTLATIGGSMATQKKKQSRKSPAKKETVQKQKEVKSQEVQPAENMQEGKQEENGEEKAVRESKKERVITILSAEDSEFLSRFDISRSAISRAVIVGCRSFLLEREEFKSATEQEIVSALVDALETKLK